MQAITDPIHILLLGGYRVGKSALLDRLCSISTETRQHSEYQATSGVNIATFIMTLKNGLSITIYLYDVSADVLHISSIPAALAKMLERSEGALLVTEGSNKAAATWTDMALDLLHEYCPETIVKALAVNKADLPWDNHVFSEHHLIQFAEGNELAVWGYTVAHPLLADTDPCRGNCIRQTSPEDLLHRIIILILQQRQDQLYKLLNLPLKLKLLNRRSLELYELDQLFPIV